MQAHDALILDAPRLTRDGFLAVRAKVARTGIYDYAGSEVDPDNAHGMRDKATVKVYRPGDQVFDRASLASFIGKPITDNHPAKSVTADNWREHARGTIMGAVRDGEYVAFDLLLTDASAIAAVNDGKRELSNGYAVDLRFEAGTAPDGTTYDAIQHSIRGNHIALVDRGRAGSDCRIGDGFANCDSNPAALVDYNLKEPVMAGIIVIDGLPVSLADEAAVRAVIAKKDAAIVASDTALADANAKLATATGEKAMLESQLSDAKAELDPAKLDARVADRAALVASAKAALPAVVVDGKLDADIRRQVVAAKLGDAATALDDAAIAGAFAVLAKDAGTTIDQVININTARFADSASVRDLARAAQY